MSQQQQQDSARTWPCLALALVPFAASCWFNGTPDASPVTGERPSAPLVFDQYLINYGERPITPRLMNVAGTDPDDPKAPKVMGMAVPFNYRNVSDQEIRIQSLTPSCGCLRPQIDSKTIAPGEYGRLLMPIRTANEAAGPHEYLVKVLYEDGRPHEVDLALKVVLPEKKVEVTPKAMWFYQSGGEPTPMQVTITDHRAKSFNIKSIVCSSDLWTVEKSSDLRLSDSERVVKLNVQMKGDIPPGKHRGIINIETDDKNYPLIQIPLGGQGIESPDTAGLAMKVEPSTIVLQQTPAGKLEATTSLTGPNGSLAKIESITTSPKFIKATYETNASNQTILKVSADFLTEAQTKTQRAIVTVKTEGRDAPLTIPVVIPSQKP